MAFLPPDNSFLHWCSEPDQAKLQKYIYRFIDNKGLREWGPRSRTTESGQESFVDCRQGMMTYPPQVGFVPSMIKSSALRCELGWLTTSGEKAAVATKMWNWAFGIFPLFGDSLSWWDLERERGGGGSWAMQQQDWGSNWTSIKEHSGNPCSF